jgi:uncharacterized ion transporter superfamily protein YfcC
VEPILGIIYSMRSLPLGSATTKIAPGTEVVFMTVLIINLRAVDQDPASPIAARYFSNAVGCLGSLIHEACSCPVPLNGKSSRIHISSGIEIFIDIHLGD